MIVRSVSAVGLLLLASACGGGTSGSDGSRRGTTDGSGNPPFGAVLALTSDGALHAEADALSPVAQSLQAGDQMLLVRSDPVNGFFLVNAKGAVGWVLGSATTTVSTPKRDVENATARASSSRGFSYVWGGESWDPTSQSPGSCSGECPQDAQGQACVHSGSWGADCSGMVAKAWKVRDCDALERECSRPTAALFSKTDPSGEWANVSRDGIAEGDVLATTGHVAYFVKGDAWGQPSVLECKGCADGCVYDSRAFGTAYATSRRSW